MAKVTFYDTQMRAKKYFYIRTQFKKCVVERPLSETAIRGKEGSGDVSRKVLLGRLTAFLIVSATLGFWLFEVAR